MDPLVVLASSEDEWEIRVAAFNAAHAPHPQSGGE